MSRTMGQQVGSSPVTGVLGQMAALLVPGASSRSLHVPMRNIKVAKNSFAVVATGLFEPFLYLLSIGVGVGVLVGDLEFQGRSYDYATFVAPAMLASAAMSGAIAETIYNAYSKFKWDKTYEAMVATPMTPSDIAFGELLYAQGRGTTYSVIFWVAMVMLGLVESWWAVLAIPAVILIGVAFSAAGLAGVTFLRSWEDFDLVLLVQMVLFLFSATFYPLAVYPEPVRFIAQLSPLYHGAALCRDLTLGTVGWGDLVHVAVLVAMTVICLRIAGNRFKVLLYG